MIGRRLFLTLKLLLAALLFVATIAPEWPHYADEEYRLQTVVRQQTFDFLVWEIEALAVKALAVLADGQTFLDESARRSTVLTYLELITEARRLNDAIDRLFIDPEVTDPASAARPLQEQLIQVRGEISSLQPLAEAIFQEQVADVLIDQGFSLGQQSWPPVYMHMTPLPSVLIVSPRERIERLHQVALIHGLTTPEREALETAVLERLDLSALVVPVGGLGTYPSMITETDSIVWLTEVTAHEWAHIWFGFAPVSRNYTVDPDVRNINETTASIVDKELRDLVLTRYYPEHLPPTVDPVDEVAPDQSDTPPAFDFQAEMAATRVRVDALLAEGRVEEAEEFMEARRQVFVANGHPIRKLNQAYFAFFGAYADVPGGAAGADPVGPMLRDIRRASPSIRAFLRAVAPVGSLADLEALHRRIMTDTIPAEPVGG